MTNIETHHDEHHSSLKDKLHHLTEKLKHPHTNDKGKQQADSTVDHAVDPNPVPVAANHPISANIPGEASSVPQHEHHQDVHHQHHSSDADPVAEHSIVHKAVGDHPGSNLSGVGVGKQLI
ncbi:hypothetical protein DFQ26_001275 [Actinomortierella ambigua]|nr:hypothetical protein DFQ26_001275 [Actinomortierella ambigua]